MHLTTVHLDLSLRAWALHAQGGALAIDDERVLEAEALVERRRLERRFTADRDMTYAWTAQAELALDVAAIRADVEGRQN